MKLELGEALGRHVPMALLMALLMQGATVVWWAAARDRDTFFMEQRVNTLDNSQARITDGQNRVMERLARIEQRLDDQTKILDRIEKQLTLRK